MSEAIIIVQEKPFRFYGWLLPCLVRQVADRVNEKCVSYYARNIHSIYYKNRFHDNRHHFHPNCILQTYLYIIINFRL